MWPEDAPHSALGFCRRHGVSGCGSTRSGPGLGAGPIKAMEADSANAHDQPASDGSATVELALLTRESLKQASCDQEPAVECGRESAPSGVGTSVSRDPAWIFTEVGVVVPEPRKKFRSAYRRFVYPEPPWVPADRPNRVASALRRPSRKIVDDHPLGAGLARCQRRNVPTTNPADSWPNQSPMES